MKLFFIKTTMDVFVIRAESKERAIEMADIFHRFTYEVTEIQINGNEEIVIEVMR